MSLNVVFDVNGRYDISTLLFWNYTSEGSDVDNIDFTFFDAGNVQVGPLSIGSALGSSPGIPAQDIVPEAPLNALRHRVPDRQQP